MSNVLAFDYGASGGRAFLGSFDGTTLSVSEVHRFPNDPVMLRGNIHWDFLRLYHELLEGIKKCQLLCNDLSGIGIDSWGVDFGLLDERGNLLGNPFHYRDARTSGMIDRARQLFTGTSIYDVTGIAFQKYNTLYQLLSMKESGDVSYERAGTLLFIPDLLCYFLTGNRASEHTIASTSQMLDIRTGNWAFDLLHKLGLSTGMLADIVAPATIIGKIKDDVANELHCTGIPVIAVAEHDTASAVVAVPATGAEGFACLSSGTWSLLGVESERPVINDKSLDGNFTNESGVNNTFRVLKNIMGLWILQECKREWDKTGPAADFESLVAQAGAAKPFRAFIDPDDDCFYRPGDMPERVREYLRRTNQPVCSDKPSIVRCILESLALKYRMVTAELEGILGYPIPVIHLIGGGSQNVLLNRFTANATAKPVIAGPVEATAIGNIIVQLLALGELGSLADARSAVGKSFPIREYVPAETAAWDDAYCRFRNIASQSENKVNR